MLLLLVFGAAWAVQQCNESTYSQFYFDLCAADAQCNYNFDLHPDEFAFFRFLMESEMLVPRNLTWVEICGSEGEVVQWLAALRVQPLCLPNQLRDPALGCIPRSDRAELREEFALASELGLVLIQLAVLAIFLYTSFKLFKEVQQARLRIKIS
jgi:hypothetical protein